MATVGTNVTFNIVKATGITTWWDTTTQSNVIVRNCTFNSNGFVDIDTITLNATDGSWKVI